MLEAFVFLDDSGRPYRVQEWGDHTWLFDWHEGPLALGWVPLRLVGHQELPRLQARAVSREMAARYAETTPSSRLPSSSPS